MKKSFCTAELYGQKMEISEKINIVEN